MTSSNGKIFRVTGHLRGKFTDHRWIPHTKAGDAGLWCLFVFYLRLTPVDLRRHRAHYDVSVMYGENCLCILWRYSQFFVTLFACFPNFGQAVNSMFNCLSINKDKINVFFQDNGLLLPKWSGKNILNGFILKIKSDSHVCISAVVKVSLFSHDINR